MEIYFDFDSIINHCDSQINLLKNKRLNEIKEEAREYSRKIECNEYKTQEELIDVKNKVIKLKQEYNDIMNQQNKKDDIKVVKIPINDNNERKKRNQKMDDDENDIKILSFNDFMKKLMYDDFRNDKN